MKIALVLFNRVTFLDFVGFYDVVGRIKYLKFDKELILNCCSLKEEIHDDRGLTVKADCIGQSLDGFDMVFIPGGPGTRVLQYDDIFISWIKSAKYAKYKVSVCTGSLLLGAAGFLKEKNATTHPQAFHELKPYCKEVKKQRIVDEGNIITAGGVSASIDLGLHVSEKFYPKSAKIIASSMDYPFFENKLY